MRRINNFKTILSLIVIILIFFPATVKAEVYEVPSIDEPINLQFNLTYKESNENVVLIQGSTLELFQIASLEVKGGYGSYTFSDQYKITGINENTLSMNASDLLEISDILYKHIISNNIKSDYISTSNEKGEVYFSNIRPGVYLVAQTGKDGISEEFTSLNPFIMTVPTLKTDGNGNKSWEYNIVANPKISLTRITPIPPKKDPTPPKPEKPKDETPLPNTGETQNILLPTIGFILLCTGILIYKKRE